MLGPCLENVAPFAETWDPTQTCPRSKNGNKLRTAFTNVRTTTPLYPTIGLHSRNETVTVNFGSKPFRFDLEGMLAEEQAQEQAAIRR